MAAITLQQLEDASRDALDLAQVVNGAANLPNPDGEDGTVETRLGGPVRTLQRLTADFEAEASAAIADYAAAYPGLFYSNAEGYVYVTRELRPGSNRYVRTQVAHMNDVPNRLDVLRTRGSWLCQKDGSGNFVDLHQIITNAPFEVRATEFGKAQSMGGTQDHTTAVGRWFYRDGYQFPGGEFAGQHPYREFELFQPTRLTRVDGAHDVLVNFYLRHVFHGFGYDLHFEAEIVEAFSLESLKIGILNIIPADGATTLFDEVRRGRYYRYSDNPAGPIVEFYDKADMFKYSGPLGLGVEISIDVGASDWYGEKQFGYVSTAGAAVFDWHRAPYSPALDPGPFMRGVIRVCFSLGKDS